MRRFRRRTVLAAGTVLLVAAGTVGCAGSPSSSSEVAGTARAGGTSPAQAGSTATLGAGGVDFSRDQEANYAASQLGQALLGRLPRFSGYAGLQIVSYGIEVDTVGSPDPQLRAVATSTAQRYRYQGGEIEIRYRLVRYSERDLKAVSDRLSADAKELAAQGIELSSWGIDLTTNKVEIGLAHYTDGYRDTLLARYGDRVTVTPHDVVMQGA